MGTLKGSYLLIMQLRSARRIKIGKMGLISFKPGYYVYAGSAMNSLTARIKRHFVKDKKLWWHIDYLTINAEPLYALTVPHKKVECALAAELSTTLLRIKRFGCSDCKCSSHLFYSPQEPGKTIFKVVEHIDLNWKNIICYAKEDLK